MAGRAVRCMVPVYAFTDERLDAAKAFCFCWDRFRPLMGKSWHALLLVLAAILAWLFFWDIANSVAAATETDQIGTVRPQGAGCDIGAIEYAVS